MSRLCWSKTAWRIGNCRTWTWSCFSVCKRQAKNEKTWQKTAPKQNAFKIYYTIVYWRNCFALFWILHFCNCLCSACNHIVYFGLFSQNVYHKNRERSFSNRSWPIKDLCILRWQTIKACKRIFGRSKTYLYCWPVKNHAQVDFSYTQINKSFQNYYVNFTIIKMYFLPKSWEPMLLTFCFFQDIIYNIK